VAEIQRQTASLKDLRQAWPQLQTKADRRGDAIAEAGHPAMLLSHQIRQNVQNRNPLAQIWHRFE